MVLDVFFQCDTPILTIQLQLFFQLKQLMKNCVVCFLADKIRIHFLYIFIHTRILKHLVLLIVNHYMYHPRSILKINFSCKIILQRVNLDLQVLNIYIPIIFNNK